MNDPTDLRCAVRHIDERLDRLRDRLDRVQVGIIVLALTNAVILGFLCFLLASTVLRAL